MQLIHRVWSFLVGVAHLPYLIFFVFWVNWGGRWYTRLTGKVWYPPK